jgi:hypothetical protein
MEWTINTSNVNKTNPFFILSNREFAKGYLNYLKMKSIYEKIDKLVASKIIVLNEQDEFTINSNNDYGNLITFCKYYFDLEYVLSARFLIFAYQKCRIYLRRNDEPMFNTDDVWYTVQRSIVKPLNCETKKHVIYELSKKGLIIKIKRKTYRLNLENNNLYALVNYLLQTNY